MFWKWGGKDIKIWGKGTLDGNGQAWYDGFAGLEILVSISCSCLHKSDTNPL
jgi:galacturan 1,4-alpha-galacturonidase